MLSRTLLNCVCLCSLGLALLGAAGCGGAQSREAKHLAKGQAFLAAESFDKARVEFQNALQIAPKDPEARLEMGVVSERLGNPREAAQFYQGVIDVSPDHAQARARLARLYLLSGVPERATELIGPGLEKHPDDAALLTVRAAIEVQQKDFAAAVSDAERAVRLDASNEDAVAVLAGAYTAQGDQAKAQVLLEQAIQKIPGGAIDLRLVLAQIYARESRPADTEAQLLKIIELKPTDKAHRVRLARFYTQSNQADAAERVLRQAIKDLPADRELKLSLVEFLAAQRGRETAEQELKAMIEAAPADSDLKFALAKFYEEGKEPAKAQTVLKIVIDKEKLSPAGLAARDRLAALRLLDNDVPGAKALTDEVLAKSPRDDEALLIRGNISLAEKDPRSAIADLRAVLRDQPNALAVLRSLARAHLANNEPAVAEETLRNAVEANPNNPVLQLDFAQLLAQLGKGDQAASVLADLVKKMPGDIDALDAQFRLAMAKHDLPTAKAAAEAIVAQRPKLAVGYMYQGMIAENDKRNEEALRLYSKAGELQPNTAEPLVAAVRVLVILKRVPEAMKRLDDVSARYPDSSVALSIKGDLLLRIARSADAAEVFKQGIARTPKWWLPYRGLANAQIAAKQDPAEAIATLRNAKSVVDQPDELTLQLASLLEQTGKSDDAIHEYEELIRREPQSEIAANNLAMLLATYKKDPASLDRAKDLSSRFADSANPSYLDTYGWVLFKRGDAAGSVPVLTRVVAKLPDAVLARYHLGMAQSMAGDDTDARDNLLRAVNSGTHFSGFDEAKATLDKLAKSPVAASTPKT